MILKVNIPPLHEADIRLFVAQEAGLWHPVSKLKVNQPIFGFMTKSGEVWDSLSGWIRWSHSIETGHNRTANIALIEKIEREAQ